MTDREKAIVMAYTGYCMLQGEKLEVFYQYLKEITGRALYTHEIASLEVQELIKTLSKPDFMELCKK